MACFGIAVDRSRQMATMQSRLGSVACPQSQHFAAINPVRSTIDVACRSLYNRGRGRGGPIEPGGGDGLILGPGLGRGGPNRGPPQKIVLPGQRPGPPSGPPGGGAGLIIPEKGMEKILQEGAEALGPEVVTLTGPNRYRPPAGFMNENIQEFPELENMTPDEMLGKLRSRAGKWHKLAKFLPYLYRQGYDSTVVDQMTGITPAIQNRWAVASTVYDSLAASDRVPAEVLASFDSRGEDMLYPLRNLSQEMRVEAAMYAVEQGYDAQGCEVLARAMKEWERRPTERLGFSDGPADCMAFKYMRDALECRKLEQQEEKMQLALRAVATDSGRERLLATLDELREAAGVKKAGAEGPIDDSLIPPLVVLRLEPEDLGVRPIPVLGALGQASIGELQDAPRTTQEGAFGVFAIEGQGAFCRWVALPQWKALAMTKSPVALSIADCAAVPAVVSGTKAKTEEDRRRLAGAGMLVAERGSMSTSELDSGTFYLVAASSGGADAKLQLMDGARAKAMGHTAAATVVFIARPPARELPVQTSDSLLQL